MNASPVIAKIRRSISNMKCIFDRNVCAFQIEKNETLKVH